MSNARGTVVFSKSKSCIFDGESLINILNQYEWISGYDNIWRHDLKNDVIYLEDAVDIDYPSLHPNCVIEYVVEDDDGNQFKKLPSDMTENDISNVIDTILDDVDFENLVNEISSCISEGYVEFAVVCNQKQNYVKFERMHVECNGDAKRTNTYIGQSCGIVEMVEELIDGKFSSVFSEGY